MLEPHSKAKIKIELMGKFSSIQDRKGRLNDRNIVNDMRLCRQNLYDCSLSWHSYHTPVAKFNFTN